MHLRKIGKWYNDMPHHLQFVPYIYSQDAYYTFILREFHFKTLFKYKWKYMCNVQTHISSQTVNMPLQHNVMLGTSWHESIILFPVRLSLNKQ